MEIGAGLAGLADSSGSMAKLDSGTTLFRRQMHLIAAAWFTMFATGSVGVTMVVMNQRDANACAVAIGRLQVVQLLLAYSMEVRYGGG